MRYFLFALFFLCSMHAFAQFPGCYYHGCGQLADSIYRFDRTYLNLTIDTGNHQNQWQIGRPQKSVFNSALSPEKALLTDSTGFIQPNDTSIVTLKINMGEYFNAQVYL